MSNYVKGVGASNAKLMIVLPMPTYSDEKAGIPAQGPEGRMLASILKDVGTSIDGCYVTTLSKYRAPDMRFDRLSVPVPKQLEFLHNEIRSVNPNAILALGEAPLFYLTGLSRISDYRGSILKANVLGKKVVASLPPSSLLFKQKLKGKKDKFADPQVAWSGKTYITLDYARAVQESKSPEINLPIRHLEIARNSAMLHQFFTRYEDKIRFPKVAVDIEVINCIPCCISFAFTRGHAISVPLINIPGNHNFSIPHSDLAIIWKLIARVLNERLIIGQNFKFDHEKLRNVCGFSIPHVYSDVMFKAHVLHAELPKKLGFTASIYTREPFYKNEGKEFNPARDNIDVFLLYNAKDAAVTFEVDEEMEKSLVHLGLSSFYYDYLMKLHPLFMDIEAQGFQVDKEKRQELIMKYGNWRLRLEAELSTIMKRPLPSTFINSPKQKAAFIFDELGVPFRAKLDEESICSLLANVVKDSTQRRALEIIYELTRVKKAEGNMKSRLDYDGKMRTSINIVGTETGRDTNGTIGPPVRPDEMGFPFQLITKHGDFGPDMRYMYVAAEGHEFTNIDLSQAEARIVALLSEDYDLLKLFATKYDIHKMTSSWVFKKPESEITEDERFCGKTVRHAGNYDMGKKTHMLDITKKARRFHINISISEAQAGQNLLIFHKNSPKIKGVFHEGIKKALVDNNRVLWNPYGRRRIFLDRIGPSLYREAYAQLPQSTVGDHMKNAMLRIKQRLPKLQIILESHDALLTHTRTGDESIEARAVMKEELEKPINFERCSLKRGELIIPTDCEIGFNYKDMKKLRA